MGGDGINDAPPRLRRRWHGDGEPAPTWALESAGVTLVKGDLRRHRGARAPLRATMKNIRQNLFFAFIYNVLGIPIGGGRAVPVLRLAALGLSSRRAMSFIRSRDYECACG